MTVSQRAGTRKTKVGRVVSDKMDKTIVVAVERLARHRVYKRVIRLTTKFKAHDEDNAARVGDRVLIEEWRPLSREKRWRLVDIVARAGAPVELVFEEPETTEAITMAAHPGKRRAAEAASEDAAAGDPAVGAAESETMVDAAATGGAGAAAGSETVPGAGAEAAAGEATGSEIVATAGAQGAADEAAGAKRPSRGVAKRADGEAPAVEGRSS